MALPLFKINELKIPNLNEVFNLSDNSLWQHLILARRFCLGNRIKLTNGINTAGVFEISLIDKKSKKISFKLIKPLDIQKHTPEKIIIQALIKNPADILAIDLLTQAGADKIIPWKAEKSIAKWKDSHYKKYLNQIISSSEQSRRLVFPRLEKAVKIKEIISFLKKQDKSVKIFILHNFDSFMPPQSNDTKRFEIKTEKDYKIKNASKIIFIVGPEGGLSPNELLLFEKSGGRIISLGENVFRSSFAGAAALLKFSNFF
ncbi:MAG: 16S rRNA (uracil(1498)-N(3))-methyltransferase [Bifidobacteriaceae bacterium]|jgi:16S rRNA (uracil1498-N3)-methyltransferase|nr:16S rRNA (uracil(1498)-N(3))-methyltransferase [Bifidobacteriaceae bacterium]